MGPGRSLSSGSPKTRPGGRDDAAGLFAIYFYFCRSRNKRRSRSSSVIFYPCGLAIDHFSRDQLIFEMRIAVDKASPLLFPMFRCRLGSLGGFNEFFSGRRS
jgi:hypothetical protein